MVRAVVFDWYGTVARPHEDDWWPRLDVIVEEAGGIADRAALRRWEALPLVHLEASRSE